MFKDLQKPYLIAEISANHCGSIEIAKDLIYEAAVNGADCVKLQSYEPHTMTIQSNKDDFLLKHGLWKGYTLWDLYKKAYTPFDWHCELFYFAKKNNITIISTPFDESAVDLLENLNTPFYKVSSFEITDVVLLEYIAKTGKPIILSTGMASPDEIKEAIDILDKNSSGEYALLHCVSGYPTPIEEINLSRIRSLKKLFDCEVGLSDHTQGNLASTLAITFGAKIIEKHFTLNRGNGSLDSEFSIEPQELKALKIDIDKAHSAIGNGKFIYQNTENSNSEHKRSIYVAQSIKKGDYFSLSNIKRVRPGLGLHPRFYKKLIGTEAICDLEVGDALKIEHTSIDK